MRSAFVLGGLSARKACHDVVLAANYGRGTVFFVGSLPATLQVDSAADDSAPAGAGGVSEQELMQ